jgi:hypothetical protein
VLSKIQSLNYLCAGAMSQTVLQQASGCSVAAMKSSVFALIPVDYENNILWTILFFDGVFR